MQPTENSLQEALNAIDQDPALQQELRQWMIHFIRNDDELRKDLRKEILTDELLQLPARFTHLEQDVTELKTDVAELKTDVTELKTDVAELKTDVAELKTDVAELKTDVAELKTDVAELKTDVTVLKTDVAELKTDVAELKTDVTVLKTDVAELKTDVAELKTDVAELKTDVAELKTDVAELKTDVTVLKTDVAELKTDVTELKQNQISMSGQIANLMGHDYESRAIEGVRRLIRRDLGMEQATLLYASKQNSTLEFENEILLPAIREGRITRQQADQLEETDCIVRCEDADGRVICAVAEISVTVQDRDRTRAAERAEIFNLATGLDTLSYVIGQDQEELGVEVPNVSFLQYEQ